MKPLKAGVPPDLDTAEKLTQMLQSVIRINLYTTVLGVTSLLVAAIVFFTRPTPQNYAIYPDGRLVELTPVSKEISPEMLSDVVSSALLTGLRFDFKNADAQIGRIKSFMSADGYNAFVDSIQGIKAQAESGRYVVSTDILQPTIIGKSVVRDGVRRYKTSTVIVISLEGQTSRIPPMKWAVESIVRRVPETENPRGFVIDAFNIKPYMETK